MVVVFPAPLGPRNPRTSPSSTLNETSLSARTRPKLLLRRSTSTRADNIRSLGGGRCRNCVTTTIRVVNQNGHLTEQTMQTGLLLPSREAVLWADGDMAFLVEAAVEAEKAGYDSVWVGDSLLARPRGEPLTLLAGIARATARVTLGTAVLPPLLRPPVALSHALATIDRISAGRVIVGIGPGAELPGTHAELKAVGVPSDRRVSAMVSAIERCRRLWRNEEPGIELQPRPVRARGPAN